MSELQPARGTHDLIGEEMRRFHQVASIARDIAAVYGFDEWITPIFEDTRVFARTLGETSDVVTKEMYTFEDRGGDSVTLRPEGTAGVCRALVTNGLTQSLPQKVFYAGPMFRYERPQKGRYRQFHQIGTELIGPAEPLADAEVVACGWAILQALGVASDIVLELNTLGDKDSRDAYRAALVGYFTDHRERLSKDSLMRLERNPLRILDSKDEGDRRIVAGAPTIEPYLTDAARGFWDKLRAHLAAFGVPFVENPRIVRGLDYYGHTAFEFVTAKLGAQGTVMAGGRYDGLVAEMGGPATPAVGWAAGIERLAMLLDAAPPAPAPVAVIPIGDAAEAKAVEILQALRAGGVRAEMAYRGNLKRRMERANKAGARAAVIVGADDLAAGHAQVKDLGTGAQSAVPFADIVSKLR
ncbi:MAG TPA: histidine--tRNA ligase [Rhodopila sp.]|uniref:histidine--tRNA ligase n=1 Tax=Rhodopila sp. TaxID=2480087 RepID=UPI002C4942F6|nr:histidine--tRNA ligase [Rhodopila sp.]HVY15445.1 histidine--tRNA ligase [Rhodopila sp.]